MLSGRIAGFRPGAAFEAFEIIADGHSERQKLFESFMGLFEFDGNAAGLEMDAGRQMFQLLADDLYRRFDKKLRLFDALPPETVEDCGHPAPALHLIMTLAALSQPAEMMDQLIPVGKSICADVIGNAGSHDLLSAAAADSQKQLDRGTVDERAGKRAELPDNLIEVTVPGWFGGHSVQDVTSHAQKQHPAPGVRSSTQFLGSIHLRQIPVEGAQRKMPGFEG